jgi:hypothetical protein
MSEATRLRAQKAYSTDPDYLERTAIAEDTREAHILPSASQSDGAMRSSPDDSKTDE